MLLLFCVCPNLPLIRLPALARRWLGWFVIMHITVDTMVQRACYCARRSFCSFALVRCGMQPHASSIYLSSSPHPHPRSSRGLYCVLVGRLRRALLVPAASLCCRFSSCRPNRSPAEPHRLSMRLAQRLGYFNWISMQRRAGRKRGTVAGVKFSVASPFGGESKGVGEGSQGNAGGDVVS